MQDALANIGIFAIVIASAAFVIFQGWLLFSIIDLKADAKWAEQRILQLGEKKP